MAIHFHIGWLLPPLIGFLAPALEAATLRDGHFTEVVRDVRLTEPAGSPLPVSLNGAVRDSSISTGPESRAEIAFRDRSVVRFGDNTQLHVAPHSRTFDLTSGAILTEVPPGVGGTLVKVRNISATVTGTTLIVECVPQSYAKFISLDGTSRLCLKKQGWGSDCILLRPGQMLIAKPDPKSLPEPVDVNLARLLETSQFITEFAPLPGKDRLAKTAAGQSKRKSRGNFADTNLVIFGRGTLVSKTGSDASPSKPPPGVSSPTPTPEHSRSPTAEPTR